MTTPDSSSEEEAPAMLSTLARTLLFICVGLAGGMFGYGVEESMDPEGGSWIQIAVEVALPFLLFLIVGYVLVEDGRRRKS